MEMGKNILFGIGNGAEYRPQNRVIESPESIKDLVWNHWVQSHDICYDASHSGSLPNSCLVKTQTPQQWQLQ